MRQYVLIHTHARYQYSYIMYNTLVYIDLTIKLNILQYSKKCLEEAMASMLQPKSCFLYFFFISSTNYFFVYFVQGFLSIIHNTYITHIITSRTSYQRFLLFSLIVFPGNLISFVIKSLFLIRFVQRMWFNVFLQ